MIKCQPTRARAELTEAYFTGRDKLSTSLPPADQHRAVNLAVQVVSMVSCSARERAPGGVLELGTLPTLWQDGVCFADFLSSTFPGAEMNTSVALESRKIQPEVKFAITAARLKKIAGLRFEPTDDLRNHLKLDAQNGVIKIYHHTSVLREHIAAHEKAAQEGSSSRTSAILSKVSREVLHSIQVVLFPFNTPSEDILRSLVRKESLDPDCIQYGFGVGEDNLEYSCFGSKLMDLYDEVDNPSPRGFMEKWFERKSGARYVMMATFVGVVIAVVLGILSLAVGIFQSWVAYQAWKHPVSTAG
ncbi:thioredoxin [Apiospora arundinis]